MQVNLRQFATEGRRVKIDQTEVAKEFIRKGSDPEGFEKKFINSCIGKSIFAF